MPWKTIFRFWLFVLSHLVWSTGSKEIFIKNIVVPWGGGGQSFGDISPPSFFGALPNIKRDL